MFYLHQNARVSVFFKRLTESTKPGNIQATFTTAQIKALQCHIAQLRDYIRLIFGIPDEG